MLKATLTMLLRKKHLISVPADNSAMIPPFLSGITPGKAG
jgi:hypothetical protein